MSSSLTMCRLSQTTMKSVRSCTNTSTPGISVSLKKLFKKTTFFFPFRTSKSNLDFPEPHFPVKTMFSFSVRSSIGMDSLVIYASSKGPSSFLRFSSAGNSQKETATVDGLMTISKYLYSSRIFG